MNKSRNAAREPVGIDQSAAVITADVEALGIEPLSPRSLILSVLLGTHPPVLSGRRLVGLAGLFGIRAGTTRTALSRMTTAGELLAEDGNYRLGARMLQRQREQDEGRRSTVTSWDGTWYTAIAAGERRSMAERRSFRSTMIGARMAELRPDIWMRPANIPEPERQEEVLLLRGDLAADDVEDLVLRLWPLDQIDQRASALLGAMERHRGSLDTGDPASLPNTFVLSAAVVRFLRVEPQLPAQLQPDRWTPSELRVGYDDFEAGFQRLLRSFLRDLT